MDDALQTLGDAARDEWADPLQTVRDVVAAIGELLDDDWERRGLAAVHELRRRRPDSPFLLAATEAALDPNVQRVRSALTAVTAAADDTSWAEEIGLRVAHHDSIGVTSLGDLTLTVLEAAVHVGGTEAQLFTDRSAIARGLGYLLLPVAIAPPEKAAVVLIPAVAGFGRRYWTTTRIADVAIRARVAGQRVAPILHPLAVLSPLNRAAYRPASTIIDVEL